MGKRVVGKRNESYKLVEYIKDEFVDKENTLFYGYATMIGLHGPKRCFISMTDIRLIILWLKARYSDIQDIQEIPLNGIDSVVYKYSLAGLLFALYPINQKPFTKRIYIKERNNKKWVFAFDNQDIAKNMLALIS